MEKEQMELLAMKFKEAYDKRFEKDDIDWKPTQYKDRSSGAFVEGRPLAYLNWAVAWRTMKEIYPDANYRVVENTEGSPLWNINGYGMVKCAVSALGVEHVETFPIMQGGRNDSMAIGDIDGRDVNDAIQRGLTKACARFGVGLYIYEGKLDTPNMTSKAYQGKPNNYNPLQSNEKPFDNNPAKPVYGSETLANPNVGGVAKASVSQMKFISGLMNKVGFDKTMIENATGIKMDSSKMTTKEANEIIKFLREMPGKPKKAAEGTVGEEEIPTSL